jgi:hypothetical protein
VVRLENIARTIQKSTRKNYLDPYFVVAICAALEWDVKSKLHFALSSIGFDDSRVRKMFGEIRLDAEFIFSMKKHVFGPEDIIISQFNISSVEQYIGTYERALHLVSKTSTSISKFVEKYQAISEIDVKKYRELVATLVDLFQKRHLIVHEMPDNISGKSKNPFVSQDQIRKFSSAALDITNLLDGIFTTEYVDGPYGEENYEKDYDAKINSSIAQIFDLETKVASMIKKDEADQLKDAKAMFLAMMFKDQDAIAASPNYRGRKKSVRLPMLYAYIEMRRQMLEIVLDEVTGYRIQHKVWGRRSGKR